MPTSHVSHLLEKLEQQSTLLSKQVDCCFPISEDDLLKLEALAEVYNLSKESLVTTLLHTVLIEVEEKMPYRAGSKVIRMEEGDPIYEDIGPMPRYLAIKKRLQTTVKCA